MSGDDGFRVLLYAMMLLLPLSALMARRVPLGQMARMALAWVAIFVVAALLFAQRDRIGAGWRGLVGTPTASVRGTVRIPQSADGHFWADARVNGVPVRMLIDSGASLSAVSSATVRAAGIDADASTFPTLLDTANGSVTARRATVARLELDGVSMTDLNVVTADAIGDTNVLGMNFLSRFAAWRVEGGVLLLTGAPE